jgi:hypothetical protein
MAGVIFLWTGIVSLLTGQLLYANQRGAMVFAPFGLLIGVVLILAAFARRSAANRKESLEPFARIYLEISNVDESGLPVSISASWPQAAKMSWPRE